MSKWCAISECYFDGPHDHATSATTLYTSGTFKATALQLDTWGHCGRCGADTGSPDVWQTLCPRCQQFAELEREIGRAVIDAGVVFHAINPAIDALIARWRKLHAEGAEGGER